MYSWRAQAETDDSGAPLHPYHGGLKGKVARSGPLQNVPRGLVRLPGAMWEGAQEFARDVSQSIERVSTQAKQRFDDAHRIMASPKPGQFYVPSDEAVIAPRSARGDELAGPPIQPERVAARGGALGQMIATTLGPTGWMEAASALEAVPKTAGTMARGGLGEYKQFSEFYDTGMDRFGAAGRWAREMRAESDKRLKKAGLGMGESITLEAMLPFGVGRLGRGGRSLSMADELAEAQVVGRLSISGGGPGPGGRRRGSGGMTRSELSGEPARREAAELATETDEALASAVVPGGRRGGAFDEGEAPRTGRTTEGQLYSWEGGVETPLGNWTRTHDAISGTGMFAREGRLLSERHAPGDAITDDIEEMTPAELAADDAELGIGDQDVGGYQAALDRYDEMIQGDTLEGVNDLDPEAATAAYVRHLEADGFGATSQEVRTEHGWGETPREVPRAWYSSTERDAANPHRSPTPEDAQRFQRRLIEEGRGYYTVGELDEIAARGQSEGAEGVGFYTAEDLPIARQDAPREVSDQISDMLDDGLNAEADALAAAHGYRLSEDRQSLLRADESSVGSVDISEMTEAQMHQAQREGLERIMEGREIELAQPFEPSKTTPAPKKMEGNWPLREAESVADALKLARTGEHLKYTNKSKDQFVGAPAGVGSRGKLQEMRDNFDELVKGGMVGSGWYDGSYQAIERVTRTPAQEMQMARELALLSSEASPPQNYAWVIEGVNARQAGERGRSILHTGKQWEGMQRDPVGPLSLKTEAFAGHLGPGRHEMTYPTNDRWMAQAWGYPKNVKSPGGTQHRFMDAETLLAMERANKHALGGRTNWTVGEIQAMAWVRKVGEYLSNQRKLPLDEGMRLAARDYSDIQPWHRGSATYEATAGAEGHLEELKHADYQTRLDYHRDPRSSWMDEGGYDEPYGALGIYQEPTVEAQGIFRNAKGELERNPARVARPQVAVTPEVVGVIEGGKRAGEPKKVGKHVPLTDRAMLEKVEAFRGYMDAQAMSASHKDIPVGRERGGPGATMGQATGFTIEHGVDLTDNQMDEIIRIADEFGYPMDESIISNRGESTIVSGFGPQGGLGRTMPSIRGALSEAGVPMKEGEGGLYASRIDAQATDYSDAWAEGPGSGAATRQLFEVLDAPDAPDVLARLDADPALRDMVKARMERDADMLIEKGWALRNDIQNARRIFSESGLEGLRQALKDGAILPAIALPALLFAVQEELDEAA